MSLLFRHMNCLLLLEVVSYCFSIFQIEEHLEKECPNTEIKCPFHIVGCTYEVWQLFVGEKYRQHRAISREVVGKSARINPERSCGNFWIHCSSKKFERMALETIDLCLRVLRKATIDDSIATVPGKVYWWYPILPFGIVACTFSPTTLLEIAVYCRVYEILGSL